jgi:hypothetical protein
MTPAPYTARLNATGCAEPVPKSLSELSLLRI